MSIATTGEDHVWVLV